jgi:iron complex outermembrane receptor protein
MGDQQRLNRIQPAWVVVLLTAAYTGAPEMRADEITAAGPAFAGRADQWQGAELAELLADTTELATKTRMNADYVPGILTILKRAELLALGVRTLADALTLVPGVAVDRLDNGRFITRMRGSSADSTDLKVLIDSVPLGSDSGGGAPFFELPVVQIERIEVIRGPGSTLYGENAFAGVINIVTSARPSLSLRYGDADTTQASAIVRHEIPGRDMSLQLNLAGWDSRGPDVTMARDALHPMGLSARSNAPGPVDNGEGYRFGQLNIALANASLFALYQGYRKNAFFGLRGILPDPSPRNDGLNFDFYLLQGRVDVQPSAHLTGALLLRWQHKHTDFANRIRPPGVPAFPGSPPLPQGLDARRHISRMRTEAEAFLEWVGWPRHRWRMEWSLSREKILTAWRAYNGDLFTFEPLPGMHRYTGDLAPLDPDAARTIHSLTIQDQWFIHPRLDLTFGVRYDHYSDVGDSFSPRLAGVWRLNDRHLVKAQIAGAFLPPSLFQLHQVPIPIPTTAPERPEQLQKITTAEIGYIFRTPNTVARATLYQSRLHDVIADTRRGAVNQGGEQLQGLELEWEQRFAQNFKIAANVSYADTLDEQADAFIPNTAKWLGNFNLFYYPRKDVTLTGRWRYVGDRVRGATDPRDQPLPGYNDLSLTVSWFNASRPGLTFRFGITNLLGEDIRSPAPPQTYEEDYPLFNEPAAWAQLSYDLP